MDIKTVASKIWSKITSRKFLMAVGGAASGIVLIRGGNTAEGAALIGTSVTGYLIAEGYVDAKAAATAASTIEVLAEGISNATTDNDTQTATTAALETIAKALNKAEVTQ